MGVATGGATVTTSFDVPAGMETGASTIQVVANGIPSVATAITVNGAPAPGAFNKTSPANAATGVATSPTLSWGASSGATSYTYCVVPSGSPACSTWTNAGTATSAAVTGLSAGVTYTWQVRALNGAGTTGGNASTWWSFTTAAGPPGAFSKISPANTATGVSTSPTLTWGASSGATSYTYCVVASGSPACSTFTSAGSATSVPVTGLSSGVTYTWQVRALNGAGTTAGNASTWWTFRTQ